MSRSPFDPDKSLSDRQEAREDAGAPKPLVRDSEDRLDRGYRAHPVARYFLRGPWEMAASILIGVGVLMLMQPFFLWAYTYSFFVILTGTVMFLIVSHFPKGD